MIQWNLLGEYTFVPTYNPANTRHGRVGLFSKDSLPVRVRNDLSFDESIVVELKFGLKIFFIVLYRNLSSNYTSLEFQTFFPILGLSPKNPSCIDLIITDQPNLVLDSGTRPSLNPYCHHKIILRVCLLGGYLSFW